MREKALAAILMMLSVALIACAPGKPDGRKDVEARIRSQSNGLISLVSYQKTNGYEHQVFGVSVYTLEYQAEVVFNEDCRWSGGPEAITLAGDYEAFRPDPAEPMDEFPKRMAMPVTAAKGQHSKVAGTMDYRKTDNGWIPT